VHSEAGRISGSLKLYSISYHPVMEISTFTLHSHAPAWTHLPSGSRLTSSILPSAAKALDSQSLTPPSRSSATHAFRILTASDIKCRLTSSEYLLSFRQMHIGVEADPAALEEAVELVTDCYQDCGSC
jgi:hypothetical protein